MRKINFRCDLWAERQRRLHAVGITYNDMPAIINLLRSKTAVYGGLNVAAGKPDVERNLYLHVLAVPGRSLQGIAIIDSPDATVTGVNVFLQPCSSAGDVKLLFDFNEVCKNYNHNAQLLWTDSGETLVNTYEGYCHLLSCNLEDLDNELRSVPNRKQITIHTIAEPYYAYLHQGSDLDANIKHTIDTMENMVEVTWKYPDEEEYAKKCTFRGHAAAVLDHNGVKCVPKADYFILLNSEQKKKVMSRRAFLHLLDGHPAFRMIDAIRFYVKPMPAEEWDELWRKSRASIVADM